MLNLLLATLAFAGPMDLAQKLESGAVCGGSETAFRLVLDKAWDTETGRDVFIGACNNNPSAPKLFPGGDVSKVAAYCAFRPALRLCLVCSIVLKTSADLKEAMGECSSEFRPGERSDFSAAVLDQ